MMKKSAIALSIAVPVVLLIFFALMPSADPLLEAAVFHFYIVTFFTFAAAVAAYLVGLVLGQDAPMRHRLMATAFVLMGSLFFIHGVLTPYVVFSLQNPGIVWAAWFTFLGGGLLFLIASGDWPQRPLSPRWMRLTQITAALFTLIFALIVFWRPQWLAFADSLAEPWHENTSFGVTFVIWVVAASRLWRIWQQTRNNVDGVMVLIAIWLTVGTVSMHSFDVWLLSWWIYHLLLLIAAITAVGILTQSYEKLRRFQPTHYYLAIGLIVTAALTLWASHLVAEFVQRGISSELEAILAQSGLMATEMPNMAAMIIEARRIGLWVAGASMGALFLVLLIVVNRADRLILRRTDELAQANADLKAAETLRHDLTEMIVHDLRTPLTAMKLSLDMLQRSVQDSNGVAKNERFIQSANRSTATMLQLVEQLLDVAQLEAGQLKLNLDKHSLITLLQTKADDFQPLLLSNEKRLKLILPDNLPSVCIDAELIKRVLDNLLNNALKYTVSGGEISLRLQQKDEVVQVAVSDNGQGVEQSEAERIFDKFYQARDKQGKPLRQGNGLGLSFCKMVVEAHNGRIWLESEPERGSTFYFTLPLQFQ